MPSSQETIARASKGYLADTGTAKGRGVFAASGIQTGEVVEICPVLKIDISKSKLPAELSLVVFHWDALAGTTGIRAVALGYGGLYNHGNPANCRYYPSACGSYLIISAVKEIPENQEITINYNDTRGAPESSQDNWFENVGMKALD